MASTGGRVAVITDSTSALGARDQAAGVLVVPLQVVVAGRPRDDDPDADPADVVEALRSRRPVTTSRPAPDRFLAAFRAAADAGAAGIVCVTLSADMSATYESALLAAEAAPVPVRVVDSRTLGMGLGFAALAGARAAADGAGLDEVERAVEGRAARTFVLFYVETLEHLRRGGRIGSTRALVGQALQVKPILEVAEGQVRLREKVRTAGRAVARLADLTVEAAQAAGAPAEGGAGGAAAGTGVEIAVQDLAAADRAQELCTLLADRLPAARVQQRPAGAVVAAHVGPGTVAVVVAPR